MIYKIITAVSLYIFFVLMLGFLPVYIFKFVEGRNIQFVYSLMLIFVILFSGYAMKGLSKKVSMMEDELKNNKQEQKWIISDKSIKVIGILILITSFIIWIILF